MTLAPPPERSSGSHPTFPGDGEMARRCRAFDWGATSLGTPDGWPAALRVAVRTVLESPIATNLWCGPDLLLVYNDAYRAVLGAKHPRALGRSGREVWGEIWPDIAELFEAIRRDGRATFAEDAHFVIERAAGAEGATAPGEAWFTFSLSPVRDDDGAVVAFLNVAVETTRRIVAERESRAARAAAEHAEARLRTVFAQAPAFLAVLRGEDHVFEFANDAYMQLVGGRDVVGRTVAEAFPELVEQGFVTLLDRVLRTGEPYVGRETPVTLAHPDGTTEQVHLDFVYQPLTSETGERMGIVAHGSNVTAAVAARREVERLLGESERARAAAEESEARLRFLANAIPVQVWTASPDGALDFVSERAAEHLGASLERLVGDGWLSVVHPDDAPRAGARWAQSLGTGEPYETEFRLWSAAHGAYRWHLARATAQRDDDGRVLRWFGTNTDIEDWKRAQAELQRLTDEALEADRAKGDFLAAMSHDLRTPLNAIGGYAQLIEMGVRGPVTEEMRLDLLRIQRSKNHLDRLVSDVLTFAKLGAGRFELRTATVDVGPLLASVVEMVAPQMAEKALTLAPVAMPPGLAVRADVDKTRQVLVNLLANSLKFTPAGGTVAIDVSASADAVSIVVRDTGIGIPEDQLERVFQPFVQAKRALNASDQGVGLGLAISRRLARAMGGDLAARSAAGAGAAFTLTLPRHAGDRPGA